MGERFKDVPRTKVKDNEEEPELGELNYMN
jgi:hypothetical protein